MTIDKSKVAQRFSLSAHQYDQLATFQNQIGVRLLDRIPGSLTGHLVDLGCGTGKLLARLESTERFFLTGIDLAPGMLTEAKKVTSAELHLGDIESTSFAENSFDAAISNAVLQWCDLDNAVKETARILKPDGLFFLTLFGPQTLQSWRKALSSVDASLKPRVHTFPSKEKLTQTLQKHQFHDIDFVVETTQQSFSSVQAMLKSVRRLGASYAGPDTMGFSKPHYRKFLASLESFRNRAGEYCLTYETFFVSCRLSR